MLLPLFSDWPTDINNRLGCEKKDCNIFYFLGQGIYFHDVEAVTRAVVHRGGSELGEITVREVAGVGTITFVYLKDPEGNILEIQHWS